mgnify:CR=1 FL=1
MGIMHEHVLCIICKCRHQSYPRDMQFGGEGTAHRMRKGTGFTLYQRDKIAYTLHMHVT